MKQLMFYTLILFFSKLTAQGINFETEWQVAVEKATKENKLIFMDIYTTWCRPCKVWDKKVFSDSSVGNFYNKNFINLKCNAEKDWGIKANKHYGYTVFPTFLFIDPISLEPFYHIEDYQQNTKSFYKTGNIEKAFLLADKYVTQYLLVEEIGAIKKRDAINFQQVMRPFATGQRDSIKEKEQFEFLKQNHANQEGRFLAYKLNNIVALFIEKMTEKEPVKKMLQWTTISLDLEPHYLNIYRSHALTLYKSKEYTKANEMIERSLSLMNKELAENDSERLDKEAAELKELSTKIQNRTLGN